MSAVDRTYSEPATLDDLANLRRSIADLTKRVQQLEGQKFHRESESAIYPFTGRK